MLEFLGQSLGYAAAGLALVSLTLPGRRRFLQLSALGLLIVAASLLLLDQPLGALMSWSSGLCCAISSTLTFRGPELLRRWIAPAVISLGALSFYAWASDGTASWLPVAAFLFGRASDWMPSDRAVRWMLLPACTCWLVYAVSVSAWGAAVVQALHMGWNLSMLLTRRLDRASGVSIGR